MLTCNGKIYDITDKEKKILAEKFDRYPIILKYLAKHYHVRPGGNGKLRPTTSVSIPYVANKMTPDGIEQWRYYESVTSYDAMGKPTGFFPASLTVNKTSVICADQNRRNVEKLFFLYFCCPFVENSENKQTEIEPSVVIEEKDKEAEVIVKRKKESLKIDQYIYGDILTAEEKKDLCLALAIRFPEGVSEDELAVELSKAVSISPRVREDFMKLIEDKFLRGVRADISKAAESGKIRFEQGAGRWYYVDPLTKKLMDSICRVTSLTEPNIALAEFLLANKEALADFRQSDTKFEKKDGKFASKKVKDDSTNNKDDIQSGGDN